MEKRIGEIREYEKDVLIISRHRNVQEFWEKRLSKIYKNKIQVLNYARWYDCIDKTLYGSEIPDSIKQFAKKTYIVNFENRDRLAFDSYSVDELEKMKYQIKEYEVNTKDVTNQF